MTETLTAAADENRTTGSHLRCYQNKRTVRFFRIGETTFSELDELCSKLGITRTAATLLCRAMRMPLLYINNGAYFNEQYFENILSSLTRIGSTGFIFPGSRQKTRRHSRPSKYIRAVPATLSPSFIKEVQKNPLQIIPGPADIKRVKKAILRATQPPEQLKPETITTAPPDTIADNVNPGVSPAIIPPAIPLESLSGTPASSAPAFKPEDQTGDS